MVSVCWARWLGALCGVLARGSGCRMCCAVSIGSAGPVLRGQRVSETYDRRPGWVGFDFEAALGRPVKPVNDSAM